MPRTVRRVIDLLTAVSLLLCVASVALCVRSYHVTDTIFLDGHRALTSELGSLDLVRYAVDPRGGLWTSSNASDPSLCYYNVAGLAAILPLARVVIACRGSPLGRRIAGLTFNILAAVSACALVGLLAWRIVGGDEGYELRLYDAQLPYPFALVLTAIAPAVWVATWALVPPRSRFAPGYCRRCGYDLRATPERCPECGRIIAEAKA